MKERVLDELGRTNDYVSGERISARLGKSRTAVWQWIGELRQDGYEIESSPRKGYRLVARPDRLYPWEVRRRLKTETLGRDIVYFPSVGSTNDVAKSAAKEGAAEGLVVVAEEQTAGRGRRGRSWASPFGVGVWSSTLLRPPISPREAPQAALVAAVATAQGIEDATGLSSEVKWPNDVLIDGKKAAGILIEMDAELEAVQSLIVGIGVNANVPLEAIPQEVRRQATSLAAELGEPVDRAAVLASTLARLESVYFQWLREGFAPIVAEARRRLAYLGQGVRVVEHDRSWMGEAVDVAADGSLLVKKASGDVVPVYAADVSLRPDNMST